MAKMSPTVAALIALSSCSATITPKTEVNNYHIKIKKVKIEQFIEKIESDYLEEALDTIKKNPKDLIAVYLNALEFERAKLMRANAVPKNESDDLIQIEIIENTSDPNFQKSSESKR